MIVSNKMLYDINDVYIKPSLHYGSGINSRNDVNLNQTFKSLQFPVPIISSPMSTVTEIQLANAMTVNGLIGILHRLMDKTFILNSIKAGKLLPGFGYAIGNNITNLTAEDDEIISHASIICIDVANGYMKSLADTVKYIKSKYNKPVMTGNIVTKEGYEFLSDAGADYIRVGIGTGCFTPEMIVKTSTSDKQIQDIHIGDLVYTHTGKLQPVIDTMLYKHQGTIISIDGIKSTENHEYFVIEKQYYNKQTHDVNSDNYLQYGKWVPAKDLNPDIHFLVISIIKPTFTHFGLHSIQSIKREEYDGFVYDLTVAEDHSYNIDGFAVHNSACSTPVVTGIYYPIVQALTEIREFKDTHNYDSVIVMDGGMKSFGDISKAIALGADIVMLGSMMANLNESAGDRYVRETVDGKTTYLEVREYVIENSEIGRDEVETYANFSDHEFINRFSYLFVNKPLYKKYYGMSSKEANKQFNKKRTAEGVSTFVELHDVYLNQFLVELKGALGSTLSYVGVENITELYSNAEVYYVSEASYHRSNPHILSK